MTLPNLSFPKPRKWEAIAAHREQRQRKMGTYFLARVTKAMLNKRKRVARYTPEEWAQITTRELALMQRLATTGRVTVQRGEEIMYLPPEPPPHA